MRFVGKVWRLLVGVKDGLVLLFMLLFFALLYAAMSATPTVGSASEGALVLKLDGVLVEQPSEADPLALVSGGSMIREHRLRDVVHALDTSARDERVKAVVLDLDGFLGGGQAALSNVGEALERVRRTGKPVLAYATGYTDDHYQLAAHASEIWLNPLGAVLVAGPGGTNLYYKGLLDRIGVTANVYRVGAFKSAVEPFTRTDMSPEARAQSEALAGALWERWVGEVRAARPKAQLLPFAAAPVERVAQAGGDLAQTAVRNGLVDRLGDRTAFGQRVRELAGADTEQVPGSYRAIRYDNWVSANPVPTGGTIGVVTVAGNIVDGTAGPGTAAGDTIADYIQRGLRNQNLKALVVRVDSPGGSTLASERIRQAVLDAKSKGIPVVISMGSVAASGGYWIATAGDHILAEPETITGSIGVFGILPSFEGALGKVGLSADGIKTTPLSGEPDLLRGPSPVADQLIQAGINNTYARFLSIVAQARGLPVARVNEIAQGRVWDGGTARQLRLVDGFGSLQDAINEAARRARIDPAEAKPVWLEKQPSYLEQLARTWSRDEEQVSPDVWSQMAARPQHLIQRALLDAQQILTGPAIQARCLQCPAELRPVSAADRRSLGTWLAAVLGR
jgi:protease IV